jgi:deazaflavin-dependent oxidoreductase (nitroreductase family)
VLGDRFLLLKHIGRKTGRQRQTVLEVMRHDRAGDRYIVCSAWGEASEWYNNLQRMPQADIVVGDRRLKVTASRIPRREAEHEIERYALSHPGSYRCIRHMLLRREANEETNDFSSVASRAPIMSLQVRSESGSLMRPRFIDAAGEYVRWSKKGKLGCSLPSATRRRLSSSGVCIFEKTTGPQIFFVESR